MHRTGLNNLTLWLIRKVKNYIEISECAVRLEMLFVLLQVASTTSAAFQLRTNQNNCV